MTPHTQLRHLRAAAKQREYLMRISDVVGYGVGFRERGGVRTQEPAFIVYVRRGRKAYQKEDFKPHQQIPERIRWHTARGTVWLPVDLIETHDVGRLQSVQPVVSGVSVGNRRVSDNTGTLGWIARAPNNQPVWCSNYHVLLTFPAHSNGPVLRYPTPGAPQEFATSPSVQDGGNPNTDNIALVLRGRRDQLVDIAVALPRNDRPAMPTLLGVGALGPSRPITTNDLDPTAPLRVAMRGRTTPPTTGIIAEYPARYPFAYPDLPSPLLMLDLIATSIPTADGDSGSVLIDEQHRVLGMLLGTGGTRSFFLHIRNIRNSMQLRDY